MGESVLPLSRTSFIPNTIRLELEVQLVVTASFVCFCRRGKKEKKALIHYAWILFTLLYNSV